MIAKLFGVVDSVLEEGLVLNVSGVGYFVLAAQHTLFSLSENEDLCLHIEHVVRPEAITLYGFKTADEKKLFQKLTSVQGVGGKSGLSILSVLSPFEIIEAICNGDAAAFKKADGVGPKVAARILTELKEYANKANLVGMASKSNIGISTTVHSVGNKAVTEDAIATLVQLGYRRQEAAGVVEDLVRDAPEVSLEKIIPLALKKLSRHLG